MPDPARRPPHARRPALEGLLAELARDLAAGSDHPPARRAAPRRPTVLLVGTARSGTTLALQWLAAGGAFTYPTNLVSRFPTAPWVGERVLRLLTDPDCDHRGELQLPADPDPAPWTSDLGKTRGLLAPHEFWYWWRRFLPDEPVAAPATDTRRLRRELAAWEAVRDRPLLMKALIADWCLPWLADVLPGALFIHVTRRPLAVMRSLLAVRRRFYGDESAWYSFRPPEYPELRDLPPADQVAGQVHHTERAVRAGLARIDPRRHFTLPYEDLCDAPAAVHALLQAWLADHGVQGWSRPGPAAFPCADRGLENDPRYDEWGRAWARVAGPLPVA